jgi:acyl-CoA dehydrogenase
MWTSGAQFAGWMFSLVRTDFEAAKHSGISFVLVPMDQEGGTVSPISLISGNSPFCETFLDDAIAEKRDLIGTMNEGWTIGKRLLQHERSGQGGLSPTTAKPKPVGITIDLKVDKVLKDYVNDLAISPVLRGEAIDWKIRSAARRLTQKRAGEQARDGKTPADTTSVLKLYG